MTNYAARHARRVTRLRLAALGAAIVAAGTVSANADAWWSTSRPITYVGTPGEQVIVDPMWVRVNDVHAATVVIGEEQQELDTSGAWVIVDLTAAALSAPDRIERMMLRDEHGREYKTTTRLENPMLGAAFEPGIPERGDVVFEVPMDALGNVTFIVLADSPHTMPRAVGEITLRVDSPGTQAAAPRPRALDTDDGGGS